MGSNQRKFKKRSGTSLPPEKRLESIVFFIDRTLGAEIVPEALRNAGINVEVHQDHFKQDTPDPVWIARCAQENWIILGNDKKIKKNPLERAAVINGEVSAFFLTSGQRTGLEDAETLIKALRKITNLLMFEPRPFIARIHPDGTVELWVNHKNVDVLAEKEACRKAKKN